MDQAKGRVPVIAGAGSNSTAEAVSLSKHAEKAGADAVLVVTPYYNKPTQEGLYQHFKAINDAIGIPIIMYNIPARSIVDINVDTMKRLYELKNIAGVKDATANMARVSQQRMAMGEDFNQLSGEDITALGFNAHGGHGCISVTSNVAPRLCSEFQAACLKGDYATALKLQDKLAPLHINLFVETSPAPIKYAMSLIGKCDNTLAAADGAGDREGAGGRPRGDGPRRPDQLARSRRYLTGTAAGRPCRIVLWDCEPAITPHLRDHGRQARPQIQARRRQPQGAV